MESVCTNGWSGTFDICKSKKWLQTQAFKPVCFQSWTYNTPRVNSNTQPPSLSKFTTVHFFWKYVQLLLMNGVYVQKTLEFIGLQSWEHRGWSSRRQCVANDWWLTDALGSGWRGKTHEYLPPQTFSEQNEQSVTLQSESKAAVSATTWWEESCLEVTSLQITEFHFNVFLLHKYVMKGGNWDF